MLELKEVDAFYEDSHVLFGVSLEVKKSEVVCLLGRNGVGKTTTLRTIMGLVVARNGSIEFEGREVVGKAPYIIARLGIGYVPQDRRIFANLTTRENLEIAARRGDGVNREWTLDRVYKMFPRLKERENGRAGLLSGGEQQMLAIARALMGNPKLLLLDEPFEGLAPMVVRELVYQVAQLREAGVSVLLAEQNASLALGISDQCYILEKGRVCHQDCASELIRDKQPIERYLGV